MVPSLDPLLEIPSAQFDLISFFFREGGAVRRAGAGYCSAPPTACSPHASFSTQSDRQRFWQVLCEQQAEGRHFSTSLCICDAFTLALVSCFALCSRRLMRFVFRAEPSEFLLFLFFRFFFCFFVLVLFVFLEMVPREVNCALFSSI